MATRLMQHLSDRQKITCRRCPQLSVDYGDGGYCMAVGKIERNDPQPLTREDQRNIPLDCPNGLSRK